VQPNDNVPVTFRNPDLHQREQRVRFGQRSGQIEIPSDQSPETLCRNLKKVRSVPKQDDAFFLNREPNKSTTSDTYLAALPLTNRPNSIMPDTSTHTLHTQTLTLQNNKCVHAFPPPPNTPTLNNNKPVCNGTRGPSLPISGPIGSLLSLSSTPSVVVPSNGVCNSSNSSNQPIFAPVICPLCTFGVTDTPEHKAFQCSYESLVSIRSIVREQLHNLSIDSPSARQALQSLSTVVDTFNTIEAHVGTFTPAMLSLFEQLIGSHYRSTSSHSLSNSELRALQKAVRIRQQGISAIYLQHRVACDQMLGANENRQRMQLPALDNIGLARREVREAKRSAAAVTRKRKALLVGTTLPHSTTTTTTTATTTTGTLPPSSSRLGVG
jgi:hypothetical protein